MCDSDEVSVEPIMKRILYLASRTKIVRPNLLPEVINELRCIVEVYTTWDSLMMRLDDLSKTNIQSHLILVDASLLTVNDSGPREMIDMVSTRHKCMTPPRKMNMAVVIETESDCKLINQIKGTDVLGVVPCERVFGFSNTILALKKMLKCETYWPTCIITSNYGKISNDDQITVENADVQLTDRQKEVLNLVSHRGLSNKKIAQVLKISESTVKIHMSAILKEYGVRNRTQLALAVNSTLRP